MNHHQLCKAIFDIDPKIRYVAAYHESGERIAGGMRFGITSLLDEKLSEESIQFSLIRMSTREKIATYIGKCNYVMADYEKVKRVTIPLGNKEFLFVSMDAEVNHDAIIKQILKLCEKLER
jgi:hypothetical protein